jgi:uncharacterized protein (TIGR02001 family)
MMAFVTHLIREFACLCGSFRGNTVTPAVAAEASLRRAWAVLLLCCWQGRAAHAQLSGSVTLVSEHVYRGASLSDGAPAPQFNLTYDGAAGWYVGAFASRYRLQGDRRSGTQYIAYAGHAQRLSSGLTLDTGVSRYGYTPGASLNYTEVYASLAVDQFNARLSYSPDYLGLNASSAYTELNGSYALGGDVSLYLHAGCLSYLSGLPQYASRHTLDGRVGVGTAWAGWRWQAAWAKAQARGNAYSSWYGGRAPNSSGTLVLSASRPF